MSVAHQVCRWASCWLHPHMSLSMTKTTKWPVRPAKTDQPGHRPSLIRVFAVCMKEHWVLSYPLRSKRRFWSDWAQAILLVCCAGAHMPSGLPALLIGRVNFQFKECLVYCFISFLIEIPVSKQCKPDQITHAAANRSTLFAYVPFLFWHTWHIWVNVTVSVSQSTAKTTNSHVTRRLRSACP